MTKNKIEIHKEVCKGLNDLYTSKNKDYGDSFGKSYKEYGLTMLCIRLEDKLNRLKSLVKNGTAQVKDESIEDTLLDLANYSIMGEIELILDKQEKPILVSNASSGYATRHETKDEVVYTKR